MVTMNEGPRAEKDMLNKPATKDSIKAAKKVSREDTTGEC
jgi:hypothetical protein